MADHIQPCVVLVSGSERIRCALGSSLERAGWQVRQCASFSELASAPLGGPAVVLTDYNLPDGSWSKVLTHVRAHAPGSELVVYSRLADEHLWAEVLCLGGFDVLSDAADEETVLRVTAAAWSESGIRTDMLAASTEIEPAASL